MTSLIDTGQLSIVIYTTGSKQNMNKTDCLIIKHGSSEADEILQLQLAQQSPNISQK
jgi:hypothetical protein